MMLQAQGFLEAAKLGGALTYILGLGILVAIAVVGYVWHEWRKETRVKDAQIKALGDSIIKIKEEDAERALLNLEVFNKLTDALDKILVDDRENAEAIKVLIKDIRSQIIANKEVFILRLDHMEDLIKDGK